MPECDRLSCEKARSLVDHAVREMSRVYRRKLAHGLVLFVNNRRVEFADPTYSMLNARHTRVAELPVKTSKLILSKQLPIRIHESREQTAPITMKLYRLPFEQWSALPRKTLKNDLRVFDDHIVSI